MTDSHRKPPRANPPSADPVEARPKSDSYDHPGREPDPTEFFARMQQRLDELARLRAERLGIPVEEARGPRRWRRAPPDRPKIAKSKPKPELTPEQRAARKAAREAFERLSRDSSTLH
jgi:hypothetical protein